MKDFLINVIETLKTNNSTINYVKTYKKGVLPPAPVYPCISALPISETYNYKYSGGKYLVNKEINLELYVKSLSLKEARQQLKVLADSINLILKENYTIGGRVHDLYQESMNFDDPLLLSDSVIQKATIPIYGLTFETKPAGREISSTISTATDKEITEKIQSQFTVYKNHATYPLTLISSLSVHTIGPQASFPAVLISGSLGNDRVRAFTGIDGIEILTEISIFTKLLDKDYTLYQNLDLTENIKRVLQLSGDLGGYLLNPEVLRIEYLRNVHPTLGLVYQTTVYYGGLAIENVFNSI